MNKLEEDQNIKILIYIYTKKKRKINLLKTDLFQTLYYIFSIFSIKISESDISSLSYLSVELFR